MIGSNVEDVAATLDRLRQSEEIAEVVGPASRDYAASSAGPERRASTSRSRPLQAQCRQNAWRRSLPPTLDNCHLPDCWGAPGVPDAEHRRDLAGDVVVARDAGQRDDVHDPL